MRTQDEILAKLRERQREDHLGFETHEYIVRLDFEHAREFLVPEVTAEDWAELAKALKSPAETIRDYMPFAWDKANGCRGISANRSVMHCTAWRWLDGKEFVDLTKDPEYRFYGKPALVKVCEEYGVDWRALDDGRWKNYEHEDGISANDALGRKA